MSGHDPTDIDITSLSVDDGVAKARSDDPRTHVQASSEYDCAHCGKLAQHRCTRCAEGVDEHGTASPTFYCGTECQTHRWKPTHQHQCRLTIDRMQLFRVGSLVQWAFYENSRALWYNGVAEVKKIEHTDDNADLMLKLYKKYDAPEFPVFPKNLFEKEGDEQAVLAASASAGTIVCELVSQLVKACKSKMRVKEVTIDSKAPRSVRFTSLDTLTPIKSPACWIFRATLRDGSIFAIDPCNAQYKFTTSQDRTRGVFPWKSYLDRLSVTGPVKVDSILSHAAKGEVFPEGNLGQGNANIFLDADVRSSAGCLASSACKVISVGLQYRQGLSMKKLMARSSTHLEHAEHVKLFKAQLTHSLKLTRDHGIKVMVMDRLRHKAQNY